MIRYSLVVFFSCCGVAGYSQSSLADMVQTERDFAAHASRAGSRAAFMTYLDTNCINFQRGQISNAYVFYRDAPDDGRKLVWSPEAAGIAAAGDLGFTTGPYVVYNEQSEAVFQGHFTSIWQWKNDAWKNIVDVGIGYGPSSTSMHRPLKILYDQHTSYEPDTTAAKNTSEGRFIEAWEKQHAGAYSAVITGKSWFNRNGHLPYHGPSIDTAIHSIPGDMKFEPVGSGISKSGDLFYVYGNVSNGTKQDNYLRIWVRYGNDWKLVLQYMAWR